jgi:hypothetical protein
MQQQKIPKDTSFKQNENIFCNVLLKETYPAENTCFSAFYSMATVLAQTQTAFFPTNCLFVCNQVTASHCAQKNKAVTGLPTLCTIHSIQATFKFK